MKTKIPYIDALIIAVEIRNNLAPYCERIEIAGSIRRRKPIIGDIELVVVPKMLVQRDLFGNVAHRESMLDEYIRHKYQVVLGADRYKKLLIRDDLTCDLFIQPDPATWGVNFALRTGSAEFSSWLVADRQKGGAKPGHLQVRDALLWCGNQVIPTLEEKDFFKALGIRFIEPEERTAGLWNKPEVWAG
jgi:DNA polymerase/3'-5' exonuclease PolX